MSVIVKNIYKQTTYPIENQLNKKYDVIVHQNSILKITLEFYDMGKNS